MKVFNYTKANARQLNYEFDPSRLLSGITAGLVTGVISAIVSISMSALIFSGNLSSYLSTGTGITLLSGVILRIVVALMSSIPNPIATPLVEQMAILAVIATSIQSNPALATPEEMFLTLVGAIVLSSLLTGAFLLTLGWLKVGELIRFLPYPVIGGFIAGTGWLLVRGSIQLMTDVPLSFSQLELLFQPNIFLRWLLGLLFAVTLLVISRRYTHFLLVPASLLTAIGLFYGLLLLTNTSVAEASTQGWLLGPFPEGSLWQPLSLDKLTGVNWSVVFKQVGGITTILVISAISLLLSASGLELVTQKDIDLNRELRVVGIANLVCAISGGMVGSHVLPDSVLAYKMGAKSRLVGLVGAALYATILLLDPSFLSILPKPVLGGLILFLGLSLLGEWLYNGWFKLPRTDYFVVVLIVVGVGTLGFLEGVGIGLIVAVFLFAIDYSRSQVIKNVFSGDTYPSSVQRQSQQQQLLSETGEQIYILELQGFIFFGTANRILNQVRQRLSDRKLSPLGFVVLDFRLVSGLDSSAGLTFMRIKQLAQKHGVNLVFTNLQPTVKEKLHLAGCLETQNQVCQIFSDLDRGIEWCENQALGCVFKPGEPPSSSLKLQP